MTKQKTTLTNLWLTTLVILITTVFYSFPRGVAIAMSTAAPWAIPLSGAVGFLLFWPVAATLAKRPGQNLIDLAVAAGGRPMAIATALLVGGYFVIAAGISVREVSEMVVTSLYPYTPQTFAMVSLVLTGALAAAMNPVGALWVGALFAWPTLFSIAVVLVGNLGWGQLRNVMPLSGHGLLPVAAMLLPLTSYLEPLLFMAIFAHVLHTPRRLVRGTVYAIVLTMITWSLVALFYLMVFPLPGGLDVPMPLFEMSRLVQGGRYFERIDAIWIMFWTFGAAGRLAIKLMAAALLFRGAFRLPSHRDAVPPLTMAVLAVALFPSNLAKVIELEAFTIRMWGFLIVLGLPLLIAMLARVRRGGAKTAAGAGGSPHA